MKKVICIFGTRPEAIKMAPVIRELKKHPSKYKVTICVTAQHRQMLDQALALFGLKPDIDLNLMQDNQALSSLTANAIKLLSNVFSALKPDLVLIQGDTTTAMAAALASFYMKIAVGHIEAGLRTNDIYNPFPEEINRRIISVLSNYNFAPTKRSQENLLREGVGKGTIFLTGNTIVDALNIIVNKNKKHKFNFFYPDKDRKLILVTAHRRESFGRPLENICCALRKITEQNNDVEIVYPVHLNPNVKSVVYKILGNLDRINLLPPLNYSELIWVLNKCYLVLTDSGGIQEEAPALGKPVLVLRNETERYEGIEAKVAKLVGTDPNSIINNVKKLINNSNMYKKMSRSINLYGDGKASERIVKILSDI